MSFLAKKGFKVTVLEKFCRRRQGGKIQAAGLTFDMGPTWYWMPDVFRKIF
jgi:phytoene desaturase